MILILFGAPSKQILSSQDGSEQNCNGRDGDENTSGIVGWGLPGTAKSSADKICVVGWRIDSLGYMLNDTHAYGFSHL